MAAGTTTSDQGIASLPPSDFKWLVPWLAVLLLGASALFWLSEPYPLSHAHWDSAYYLSLAKDYHEGGLLPRLRSGAPAVHDELMAGHFQREYAHFTRLGQIVLVGTAVGIVGSDEASIGTVVGMYRVLLAAGLLVAVILSIRLIRTMAPEAPAFAVRIGAVISLALYLLSDIASYMSGNLVSEVPALLLISLSAWTFVVAWETQLLSYAAISGLLGWMLYVVRMESVWLYISFLLAFAVVAWPRSWRGWTVFAVAATSASLLYLAYSWAFLPLTDPRLFTAATTAGVKLLGGSVGGTVNQVVAANGLLWVGAAVTVPMLRSNRAARLGMVWLMLAMVPIGVAIRTNYGTQTRMFSTLMPALLLLSTIGWSHVVVRISQGASRAMAAALLLLCVAGVAISQPYTYSRLRALPGMWRLQFIHEYLATKRFERIDYHSPELLEIRRALDELERPFSLIASPGMQAADHIMIIQYLSPPDRTRARAAATGEMDAEPRDPVLDVHLSDKTEVDRRYIDAHPADKRIYLVGTTAETSWFEAFSSQGRLREIHVTPNFKLAEVARTFHSINGIDRASSMK